MNESDDRESDIDAAAPSYQRRPIIRDSIITEKGLRIDFEFDQMGTVNEDGSDSWMVQAFITVSGPDLDQPVGEKGMDFGPDREMCCLGAYAQLESRFEDKIYCMIKPYLPLLEELVGFTREVLVVDTAVPCDDILALERRSQFLDSADDMISSEEDILDLGPAERRIDSFMNES
jgi:hypothetical protein